MLCNGEELRKLTISVKQLLDRSAKVICKQDEYFAHNTLAALTKGWKCCIAVFVYLGFCPTAEAREQ